MGVRRLYDFGPFQLDPAERRLIRDGKPIGLTPKSFDLLVVLVENRGHLLEKEKLLERVWPNQFVEESNLSFNISVLRKALGEGQEGQRYIETVPKKGFRFVVDVEEYRSNDAGPLDNQIGSLPAENRRKNVEAESDDAVEAAPGVIAITPTMQSSQSKNLRSLFVVLAAGIALLLTFWLWQRQAITPDHRQLRTIAVLPFKPLSVESREESLEMGMAEALITKLGRIKRIVVRPMGAVRKYTDAQQDPIKAGKELQADAVLDGSIQTAGDRVRVTVRLINIQTGASIWQDQFDAHFTDIFKVQDSISERVTQGLILKLSGAEREQLTKHATESPEAYQLYLQGQYLFFKSSGERAENFRKSLGHFQKAIEKDPQFAPAYIGIAHFYINVGDPKLTRAERYPKAKAAVLKALELDSGLAEAHNALGELKYQYEFDWLGAGENFRQAIDLDPHNAYFHLAYGWYLMCLRRFDEAKAELERAQELEPSSFHLNKTRGILMLFMREYDEALRHYQKLREIEPTGIHRNQWSMSVVFEQMGRYSEAVEEFLEDGRTREYLTSQEIKELREVFRTSGWKSFRLKRINLLEEKSKKQYISPTTLAGLYALEGDKDRSFAWLEKAIEMHDGWLTLIKIQPAYDNLRSDPRFLKMLQRVNLTPQDF
jgi:DNA-binding winged helix-turn-helix (wHTH) protein/TolB-like protein